jgi:hypothetical protein
MRHGRAAAASDTIQTGKPTRDRAGHQKKCCPDARFAAVFAAIGLQCERSNLGPDLAKSELFFLNECFHGQSFLICNLSASHGLPIFKPPLARATPPSDVIDSVRVPTSDQLRQKIAQYEVSHWMNVCANVNT